jgi:hypothetical protein
MSAEETQVSQPVTAPVEAPPAAAPAPTPELPPTTDRRELLSREMAKAPTDRGKHAQHQPRTPQGQFNGPPKAPKVEVAPVVPVVQRPSMPKSLKAEMQAHWDSAHVDLLNEVIRRESDYEKGIGKLRTAKSELDELLNEFKPYEQIIQSQNATPKQVIGSLMRTAAILHTGSPVQKASAVAETMRQFGISFEQVQQLLSGSGAPAALGNGAPAIDPRISELEQRFQALNSQLQQQSNATVESAVEKFLGNPENKYADAVWQRMVPLLQNPQTLGDAAQGASIEDRLKLAYEAAIRLDPEVFAKVQADQQAKQQAEQQIAQARQAAVQVSGAPTAVAAPELNPKDRREFLRNQFSAQR